MSIFRFSNRCCCSNDLNPSIQASAVSFALVTLIKFVHVRIPSLCAEKENGNGKKGGHSHLANGLLYINIRFFFPSCPSTLPNGCFSNKSTRFLADSNPCSRPSSVRPCLVDRARLLSEEIIPGLGEDKQFETFIIIIRNVCDKKISGTSHARP